MLFPQLHPPALGRFDRQTAFVHAGFNVRTRVACDTRNVNQTCDVIINNGRVAHPAAAEAGVKPSDPQHVVAIDGGRWNAQYLDDAIAQLRATGRQITDEHLRRLSPLRHEHIKMLGHFPVTLPHDLADGHHRPLRELNQGA